jgi:ADP-ribosylglycohydrolase
MSLAVAEAILSGERWTPALLARHFVAAFRRDRREGYASRFYQFLTEVHDADEFLACIRPDSDKSGAAMRACPVGVFPSVGTVIERAKVQAAVTHDTPDGTNAAVAVALMTHYFLYRLGPKADVGRFLAAHVPGPWEGRWAGKVGAKGMMSAHAAVTAVRDSGRMSDLLKACVAYTGDVDTVAAVALGAASCCDEVEQDLPEHLVLGLEDGPYGLRHLRELDARLLSLVRR